MSSRSSHEAEEKEDFVFEICKIKLGAGSSGTVFLGKHPQTHDFVAVKRLFTKKPVDSCRYQLPSPMKGIDCYSCKQLASDEKNEQEYYPVVDSTSTCYTSETAATISSISGENTEIQSNLCDESNSEKTSYSSSNDDDDISLLVEDYNYDEHVENKNYAAKVDLKEDTQEVFAQVPVLLPCESTILRSFDAHHHIVKFLGSHTTSAGVTFLAMELMDSDLGRELRAGNKAIMSEDIARPFFYSVLSSIAHLHKHGIVHRDIKPSNILIRRMNGAGKEFTATLLDAKCDNGGENNDLKTKIQSIFLDEGQHVKAALGDFSAAHFAHESSSVGSGRGTLYYKAPEQLIGRTENFLACDMWALGCTMFELITGSVAFCGSSDLQVLHQICVKLGTSFQFYPAQVNEATLFNCLVASSPAFLDLLKGLLTLDPGKRLTASKALEHVFFKPILQKYGAQIENLEVTFPLRLRCCRYVDITKVNFRPITTIFSTRPIVEIIGGSPHVTRCVNALDTSFSCSAKKCSAWSLSFSVTPSPLHYSARVKLHQESLDISHRCSHIGSGWRTCNAARRLSVSSCTPRNYNEKTHEKDERLINSTRVVSPVMWRSSPLKQTKNNSGAVTTTTATCAISQGTVLFCARSSNVTIGNMRTSSTFERAPITLEYTALGSPVVRPRVLFGDETNFHQNATDLPQVQKMLFATP